MSAVVLFVFDFGDPLFLEAAKEAVRHFANLFVLQARPQLSSLKLGLCALCKPAHVPKVQLQVKLRPSELSLREVALALSKVQCSTSSDAVDGAQAAMGLYNLVQLVCSDKDTSSAAHRKTVVLLTDRQYEAEDFQRLMQPAQEKHVRLDLYFATSTAQLEAAAGAWPELEVHFPSLRVSVVESPGKEAYHALPAVFLERYAQLESVPVTLQFKVPLLGDVRSLQLSARPALLQLHYDVDYAPVCTCHRVPGLKGCMGGICKVTGEPMASGSSRDPRTVQLGSHPGGLLHFASPFNIAVGSSSQASLTVLQRVKREEFNPACMVGAPLLLSAQESVMKVMHEGALLDVTHCQLLQALAEGLRGAQELLICSTSTNLETGQAGLFRHFYAVSPDSTGQALLLASRLVTAEELPPPATASPAAGSTEMPQALVQAVQQQLSQVQLGAFEPLAFSSRCHETVQMLVLESKPLPKPVPQPQAPANPARAAAVADEVENRQTPAAVGGSYVSAGGVAHAGATMALVQPLPVGKTAQQPAARHPAGKGKKTGQKQSGPAKGLQLKRVSK